MNWREATEGQMVGLWLIERLDSARGSLHLVPTGGRNPGPPTTISVDLQVHWWLVEHAQNDALVFYGFGISPARADETGKVWIGTP